MAKQPTASKRIRVPRGKVRLDPRSSSPDLPKRGSGVPAPGHPKLKTALDEPSWTIRAKGVEASITRAGGMIAPVTFTLDKKKVAPLHVAPWHRENLDKNTPTILRVLRGDFFCMPFGGNTTPLGKEKHPVHGEVANSDWALASYTESTTETNLQLKLQTRVRQATVEKRVRLVAGHHAVYQRNTIRGATGPMCLGHHAMLRFPDAGGIVSTSPFVYGQVYPEPVEKPEDRGYSVLKPGATFSSLESVPMITGETADLTRYPARRGFEDLVMMVTDPALDFGWTAVVFPSEGYAWFALKDVSVLRNTILWMSNGGRHYAPWNGRHVNVMGLEETTSYFHPGLAESAKPNPISKQGFPTSIKLDPKYPTTVNYIFGVVAVPPEVKRIDEIERSEHGIMLHGGGLRHEVPLDMEFLFGREK